MSKEGKNGITAKTPKNIPFGAGTIHKNLKYSATEPIGWNFTESLMGATSGGSKLTITPKFLDVEIDGAMVEVKGLKKKTGEIAEIKINFAELSTDILKSALIAKYGISTDTNYDLLESKPDIETGDYFENIAFVGKTLDGRNIIVILDNAICTSGLETEGKAKENSVVTLTFKSTADLDSDMDTLPYHIYYPKAVAQG